MRAALSLCLLTASVASCHRTLKAEPDAAELNLRPLIGILSQPGGPSPNSSFSYIAASYVKFVEASGGRAVPIQYDLTKAGVKKICNRGEITADPGRSNTAPKMSVCRFDNINGVLIPGGGAQLSPHHQFYDTAAYLVNLTTAANDAGDYFPLHGTCLGMEVLSVILSKPLNTSILTIFDSEDNASELILTSKANGSRFFNSFPPEVLQNLQTQPLAMENHAFGLSYETYTANSGLQEFFAVTSLSLDRQGAPYVSTIEARSYPVTATQWHPEKNAFEWAAGLHIPHTPEAVEVTHAVSNFLINEARRNKHSPGSRKKEIELLINRFPVAFTGQARSEGIETGFDECYFLPTRQKAVLEDKMPVEDAVEAFCTALRRRQIEGSLPTAKKTTEILRLILTTRRHADGQQIVDEIRSWGTLIQSAKPSELAVGNMVRRVLHMVREECQREAEQSQGQQESPFSQAVQPEEEQEEARGPGLLSKMLRKPGILAVRTMSLHNLLDQLPAASLPLPPSALKSVGPRDGSGGASRQASESRPAASEAGDTLADESERHKRKRTQNWKGKAEVVEQVNELISELDGIASSIASQALDHMHANEVILTFGHSNTAQLFLKEAAKKRNFQVVVAEGAPDYGGHKLARSLAEAGIDTTAIADSTIFAMMARVNKVLMGAHALLANGGVMAPSGAHMVALAAKRHSVPFVVLAGLHKLSPLFPHDPSVTFNDFKSPSAIADYSVVSAAMNGSQDPAVSKGVYTHVPNPTLDYVPPELISLFITDTGGHTPSYVYRLLAEYYTREDYGLS